MSATKLQAIANAIVTALSTIDGLKVYNHEPLDVERQVLDGLVGSAAVTVLGPTEMGRVAPDDPELGGLGPLDWYTTWMVRVYISMQKVEDAQRDYRALLGQMVAAIDADRGLGGEANIDATLTRSELGFSEDRTLIIGECRLEVFSRV